MSYVVAVIGATGNVGREMLNILAERNFPVARVDAVASRRSQGKEVSFGDKTLKCQALEFYDFAAADIALFACGSGPAEEYAPKAAAAGCVVIDNSSLYRMEADVPLIVPEVNPPISPDTRSVILSPIRIVRRLNSSWRLSRCTILPKFAAWWWRPISPFQARAMPPWTNCLRRPALFL